MTTLVIGASGATGKHLVEQLLNAGQQVKVIIRPSANIPESWQHNEKVTIIKAQITDIAVAEMANYLKDCKAIVSCLGHNLSWKGIYGKPRKLVTNTVRLICNAIEKAAPESPLRLVLMNTAGNRNRDLPEPVSFGQKIVVGLIRWLLPPHSDNEQAADFLRTHIGQQHPLIEWVVVRPDTLINEEQVSTYELHVSPTRSAIFNPGKTARINVGHFMATLITDPDSWTKWRGQMPVIYNKQD
ncbi:MAG TPA: SDR family oxidoreductase [Saprospiraceae bacterium]|nr:SDR family oxidoreductase [Saprospiraceae bacterium]HMP24064.1 SDR family oxidoreductase [Saprospiraceae bacterium]